jgi:TM2 domain-containing membrane protein YozV
VSVVRGLKVRRLAFGRIGRFLFGSITSFWVLIVVVVLFCVKAMSCHRRRTQGLYRETSLHLYIVYRPLPYAHLRWPPSCDESVMQF